MDASQLNEFDFELVSPERKLMSKKAWQVTIPGGMGTFGVRAGHTSLLSTIEPGVIEILENENDNSPERVFVAGGFADVTATNCTVLAEHAVPVAELDLEFIRKTRHDLEERRDRAADDAERYQLEKLIAIEIARENAAEGALN